MGWRRIQSWLEHRNYNYPTHDTFHLYHDTFHCNQLHNGDKHKIKVTGFNDKQTLHFVRHSTSFRHFLSEDILFFPPNWLSLSEAMRTRFEAPIVKNAALLKEIFDSSTNLPIVEGTYDIVKESHHRKHRLILDFIPLCVLTQLVRFSSEQSGVISH